MINDIKLEKNNFTVKLQKITLHNFKNVEKGEILFQSYIEREKISKKIKQNKKNNEDNEEFNYDNEDNEEVKSDIVGLYGQNGSGKTSLVDALNLLKVILSGEDIPEYARELIGHKTLSTKLEFIFYIKHTNFGSIEEQLVFYDFEMMRIEKKINIIKENLSYQIIDNGEILRKSSIIEFDINDKEIIKPRKRISEISKKGYSKSDIAVGKELSQIRSTSFIFANKILKMLPNAIEESKLSIEALNNFAKNNLIVIRNDRLRAQNGNDPIPFNLIIYNNKLLNEYLVAYKDNLNLSMNEFNTIKKTINQINIVINALIPGLQIKINEIGDKTLSNGESGKMIELLSERENKKIPLVCESDGIKKIIAILSAMIAMCNDENVCLVVDELDAGIYEYLLGELVYVLEESAQGQFIFTSHNLRVLETLSKDAIVFTTTNPLNRYLRFANVKNTNNLRDYYIRSIVLGGQKEELYDETDRYDIGFAFYDAWEDSI